MMTPCCLLCWLHARPAFFTQIQLRARPREWHHPQWAVSINSLDSLPKTCSQANLIQVTPQGILGCGSWPAKVIGTEPARTGPPSRLSPTFLGTSSQNSHFPEPQDPKVLFFSDSRQTTALPASPHLSQENPVSELPEGVPSLHTAQCPAGCILSPLFLISPPIIPPSVPSLPASANTVLCPLPCSSLCLLHVTQWVVRKSLLTCSCFSPQSPLYALWAPSLRPEGLLFRSMSPPSCSVPRGLCTCPSCCLEY